MTTQHWVKDDVERKTFWRAVNELMALADVPSAERRALVHAILKTEHVEDFAGTRAEAIQAIHSWLAKEYPEAIPQPRPAPDTPERRAQVEAFLSGNPTPSPAPAAAKEKPMQAQPTRLQNEAGAVAWTAIVLNGYRINVTARSGATTEEVASTVMALIGGLRALYERDDVKTLGAVQDGRDRVQWFKPDGQQPQAMPVEVDEPPARRAFQFQRVPVPQPQPQPQPPAQPSSADTLSETITEALASIEKVLGEDGQPQYRLYPMLTNGRIGQYPFVVRSSQPRALALLEAHFDLEGMALKHQYPAPEGSTYAWRKGKAIPSAPGKFYRDLVRVHVPTAADGEPEPSEY